ncbi:MAG: alkaline phosphatase D family protein [Myxococcota bacterium]|nr:alkaline phosphatase D family protein [Myxococcota bacterium]
MSYTRREFLRRLGLTAGAVPLATALTACDETMGEDENNLLQEEEMPLELPTYSYDGEQGPEGLFSHGVASGDPLTDAVILWTRVSPDDPAAEVEIFWEMATDPELTELVAAGYLSTSASRDFTVKVDVAGLLPGTTYYYRFRSQDRDSNIGRTRTAPDEAQGMERMRFAVTSCSNFSGGYFHVYRQIANRHDLDLVIHLGDYIYEYASRTAVFPAKDGGEPVDRSHLPPVEILTLKDYRVRYAQYRTDEDLQEAHRQHVFVCVWDDHEAANDAYKDGAQNHSDDEGEWSLRKEAARQAYFEWMPVRAFPMQEGRLWRAFSFGGLVDLVMLDTRIWGRDEQVGSKSASQDEERTLLGEDQQEWLFETLRTSTSKWRFLGQQVMMGQLGTPTGPINFDQWDGYDVTRQMLFDLIQDEMIDNVVVLTGDIHTSWAIDLSKNPYDDEAYDPDSGEGALAVEFVTPSVTSPALEEVPVSIVERLARLNPHIKYFELTRRGYVIVDVTAERVQGAWFLLDRIDSPDFEEEFAVAFHVDAGAPFLISDAEPAEPRGEAPQPAPRTDVSKT